MLEFRAEPHTAETLTRIADTIDVSRSDLLLSMVKFALANHDWARFGLTHKTIPYYQGNPIMATKKPTAKQLEARARFAEMARSGAFKKRKANPRKKTVSQKISQLVHEGYPQKQAVAVALSEQRAGKVKKNPSDLSVAQTILQQLGGNKFIAMTGAKEFVGGTEFLGFKIPKNMSTANRVTIKYYPARDMYEVDFIKSDRYGLNAKTIKTFDNVYADQLRQIFTSVTGMETSLGTLGRKTNPAKRSNVIGPNLDAWMHEYRKLEDVNAHSENVVRLADLVGTKADQAKARKILADQDKRGYLSQADSDLRYKIHSKLWPKLQKLMNARKANPAKRKERVSAVVLMNPEKFSYVCIAPMEYSGAKYGIDERTPVTLKFTSRAMNSKLAYKCFKLPPEVVASPEFQEFAADHTVIYMSIAQLKKMLRDFV